MEKVKKLYVVLVVLFLYAPIGVLVAQRLAAYNSAIQQAATANNWLYVNPNEVFEPFGGRAAVLNSGSR